MKLNPEVERLREFIIKIALMWGFKLFPADPPGDGFLIDEDVLEEYLDDAATFRDQYNDMLDELTYLRGRLETD